MAHRESCGVFELGVAKFKALTRQIRIIERKQNGGNTAKQCGNSIAHINDNAERIVCYPSVNSHSAFHTQHTSFRESSGHVWAK